MDLAVDIRNTLPPLRVERRFAAGSTTAVVGPNGAGKTTLLRVLAGLLPGDEGTRITLGDRVFRDQGKMMAAHRRGVGMLSQDAGLFPHLSVRSNIAFAPSAQHISRTEVANRVDKWMTATEVTELADRKPGQLSGGQAQRVAIARALAAQPRILLLDEPFRALDVDVAGRLRALLRSLLADRSRITVMVTHDLVDAVSLADDVLVLDGGNIIESGPTREVLTSPASRFTATLSGLNLFTGTVDSTDDPVGVVGGSGQRVSGTASAPMVIGERGAAAFSPRAVAVYLRAAPGSPRTVLRGIIVDVVPRGEHALVRCDVGGQSVAAEVTWAAVADLGLVPGLAVELAVKAADVRVYGVVA